MLSATAARLAAIEVLCPTAARQAGTGFPTLALHRVYDSRQAALEDIDPEAGFTPILALHTNESGARLRSGISDARDRDVRAVIDIVAELAVAGDQPEDSDVYVASEGDPQAKMVLEALTAQVRYLLEHAPSGRLFRKYSIAISEVEVKTFGAPDLGIRFLRNTIRLHIEVDDDDFDVDPGSLPEPCESLRRELPAGSYAKAKLDELAAQFAPQAVPALKTAPFATVLGLVGEGLPQD